MNAEANRCPAIESEEDQMNRAMAMSMSQSQTPPVGQETGTIGYDDKPFYGPANREYYDPSEWAMTCASTAKEILLNPDPAERTRSKNTPAFLKPSASGHRLPALIKILHAIPMVREALLNRNHTLSDYGCDKDWWDGTPIKVLRIVNMDTEGRKIDGDDIIYESQRLMAFLDETDRAYGSADVLAAADGITEYHDDKVAQFLTRWGDATSRTQADRTLAQIFGSTGIKIDTIWGTNNKQEFCSLDVKIDSQTSDQALTLYDALDQLLWGDNSASEQAYLEEVGDIVTMEVTNSAESAVGLGIQIPSVWYPDRYLSSSVERAKEMVARKAAIHAQMQDKGTELSEVMKVQRPSDGSEVDGSQLIVTAAERFEQTVADKRKAREEGEREEVSEEEGQGVSVLEDAAKELKILGQKVALRLEAFEEVNEGARQQLRDISRLYTKPSDDPKESPHHRYTLRGVSIGAIAKCPHKLYVLERTKPEEVDDMLSTEAKDWQWWKLDFVSNGNKPVVHEMVSEDEVLKAASSEAATALLVYASERAVSYEVSDLPPQLHNFVRADNLFFSSELEASIQATPATPSKRKAEGEEDWDMETLQHRSPPYDRNHDIADDLDPNPPNYYDEYEDLSPPPALPNRRSIARKPVSKPGSYDDTIPTSLRMKETSSDPTTMIVDFDNRSDQGQEMQERGGGKSLLQSKNPYRIGSYTPTMEIDLEDDEK